MTLTASSSAALAPGLRPLAREEHARLEWLREQLRASRVDVTDPAALGALVDSSHAGWARSGSTELPAGMLAALGVGLGDLLIARAPGATWVLRTVDGAGGPAIVDASGEAVVLPLEDVRSRWAEGRTQWLPGYVAAAAGHLHASGLIPQPRTVEPSSTAEPVPAPSATPVVRTDAEPATPITDPSTAQHPEPTSTPRARPAGPTDVAPRPASPADLPVPPSERVQELALRALDEALDCALVGGDALPFVMVASQAGWHVERFAGGSLGDARAWAAVCGAPRAAVAWLGELDGEPAVFAEASDARRPGLRVAHAFERRLVAAAGGRRARPRIADPVGDLVLLGQSASVL